MTHIELCTDNRIGFNSAPKSYQNSRIKVGRKVQVVSVGLLEKRQHSTSTQGKLHNFWLDSFVQSRRLVFAYTTVLYFIFLSLFTTVALLNTTDNDILSFYYTKGVSEAIVEQTWLENSVIQEVAFLSNVFADSQSLF